jgi:hypothetical protein
LLALVLNILLLQAAAVEDLVRLVVVAVEDTVPTQTLL